MVGDGESGLLVPVGDRTALIAALERLVGDPALRRRMGAKAASVVEARYGVAVLEGRLLAEYDSLIEGRDHDVPRAP
jgi:glycosyltransferase involved in cell wall biosynthesis